LSHSSRSTGDPPARAGGSSYLFKKLIEARINRITAILVHRT
jgi:hypothetical protein